MNKLMHQLITRALIVTLAILPSAILHSSEPSRLCTRRARTFPLYQAGSFQQHSPEHKENEDFLAIAKPLPNVQLCGVYDGHGGSKVARCLSQNIPKKVAHLLQSKRSPESALAESYRQMDEELFERLCPVSQRWSYYPVFHQGSTAVTALITPKHIVVANTGDSRAVLATKGRAIALSNDHKPNDPQEHARILAAGGTVEQHDAHDTVARVNGLLAMSRAFGDYQLRDADGNGPVIATPDITQRTRNGDDQFLILASDGVWDVMTNKRAVDVVEKHLAKKKSALQAAQQLVRAAQRAGSFDDVTAIVTPLKQYQQKKEKICSRVCHWLWS